MKVVILSDTDSWKNAYLPGLIKKLKSQGHRVSRSHDIKRIPKGDLLFSLGFTKIIPSHALARNKHNLIIHESDLPRGRGWSPLSWQILEGANEIPITLFEAVEKVDAGRIYLRERVSFKGNELIAELREKTVEKEIQLVLHFVQSFPSILKRAKAQTGAPSYYSKRTREHSRLDPDKTLHEQFNLLRVVDNEKYPAFFTLFGCTYLLHIRKKDE